MQNVCMKGGLYIVFRYINVLEKPLRQETDVNEKR